MKPSGAGADQQEQALGGFNASLRDQARLGLLLAHTAVGDQQLVPRDYLLDATDPARQPGAFQPGKATPHFGYGHQFWLFLLKERSLPCRACTASRCFTRNRAPAS